MEETLSPDRFIAHHRNQINPEPHPASTLTFAYGNWRYEELERALNSNDQVLRRKVLIEVNEDFHQADKLNSALESEILVRLVACFEDKDSEIRELASRAVLKVTNTEMGRVIFVSNNLVEVVATLFNDPEETIRNNAYVCLLNLAQFTFGMQAAIDADILRILVDKLVAEKAPRILELILELINTLLHGDMATPFVLNTPVLQRLNGHLASKEWRIRELAAENLGSISFNVEGKQQTIEAESIPPLCSMLKDPISDVRCAAVRALASLAQLKEGKVQIYDLDMLNTIIELLFDLDEQTRLHTVQLIAAEAEYPPGREKFKQCLNKLRDMVEKYKNTQPLVSKHAQIAIDVITWQP